MVCEDGDWSGQAVVAMIPVDDCETHAAVQSVPNHPKAGVIAAASRVHPHRRQSMKP
jgi:hypothetical protein